MLIADPAKEEVSMKFKTWGQNRHRAIYTMHTENKMLNDEQVEALYGEHYRLRPQSLVKKMRKITRVYICPHDAGCNHDNTIHDIMQEEIPPA